MENKKKIVLVDSNNIAYRAFYALPQTIAASSGTMSPSTVRHSGLPSGATSVTALPPGSTICAEICRGCPACG